MVWPAGWSRSYGRVNPDTRKLPHVTDDARQSRKLRVKVAVVAAGAAAAASPHISCAQLIGRQIR